MKIVPFLTAMAVTLFIAIGVAASPRSDCIATCKGLAQSDWPECFKNCPPEGAAPPATTPSVTTATPPATTATPPKNPPRGDPSCPGINEVKNPKGGCPRCICAEGFERFPATNEGTCVPLCGADEARNNQGACVKVFVPCPEGQARDAKNACVPLGSDCKDPCAAGHEGTRTAILAALGNLWLLWVVLVGVLVDMVLLIVLLVRGRKEEDEEPKPPAKKEVTALKEKPKAVKPKAEAEPEPEPEPAPEPDAEPPPGRRGAPAAK